MTLSSPSGTSRITADGLATLTNLNNNTIAGAGTITDSFLTVNNGGTINANNGSAGLTIGAPLSPTTNSGILEATSSGGLTIDGLVGNVSTIRALGTNAKLVLGGTAIDTGAATIQATGTARMSISSTPPSPRAR